MTDDIVERNRNLWVLAASPAIWAAHFLVSYATAAIWWETPPNGGRRDITRSGFSCRSVSIPGLRDLAPLGSQRRGRRLRHSGYCVREGLSVMLLDNRFRLIHLGLGLLTLAAVWLGPLARLAPGSFAAHMTMHMGVVAVAAPLLALGLAGGRFDPVGRAPRLLAPIPASVVELVVVWAWHAPVLHHAARHSAAGLLLEQGSFLGSGLLVWLSAFGGGLREGRERTAAGVVALLLTSMHMTLLGALLALARRPLYGHGSAWDTIAALEDQHLGGAIMLLVGGISYLAGGLGLTVGLLRGRSTQAAAGSVRERVVGRR
jgi:putative membrane protein